MSFYYPLTLGVRQLMSVRGQRADPFPGRQYDTWREGVQRLEYAYEEHPEAQVLRESARCRDLIHRSGITLEQLPHTDSLLWEKVGQSQSRKGAVAADTLTPPRILSRLARDDHADLRQTVHDNSATPPEVRATLVRYGGAVDRFCVLDVDERYLLARDLAAPSEVLAMLARDNRPDVREGVAINPATPPELLAMLARDADEDVRRSATRIPGIFLEDL